MGAVFAAIIVLSIAMVISIIALCIIYYHQMLLVNEVNKRLLLITRESIERERTTKEELTDALVQLSILTNTESQKDTNTSTHFSEDEIEANFYSDTNY